MLRRQPELPTGCPNAIAPPLTFSLFISAFNSFAQARGIGAKASLTSKRSMSFIARPAFFKTICVAGMGPVSINEGSDPITALAAILAIGVTLSAFTLLSLMRITADDPSVMVLDNPAVIHSVLGNTFNVSSFSTVVSGLMVSSVSLV